ncbi:MAG: PIN domain nuclease [Chloroflexi bacterium]|nr:PIN domain nuclease [Chloroflexota bacterium]
MIGFTLFGLLGWGVGGAFSYGAGKLLLWGLLAGLLGATVMPYGARAFQRWLKAYMSEVSGYTLVSVMVGLMAGLLMALLFALPLSLLPGVAGRVVPAAAAIVMTYLGVSFMTARSQSLAAVFESRSRAQSYVPTLHGSVDSTRAIVDTSAIIDGRIADIGRAGFAPGTLVIPKFVLEELQYIADSSDDLRRQRGRRGLEMLNKLQKEAAVPVEIEDIDFRDVDGVDAKLIRMARDTGYPVVTNDFGLNRVAELQGVRVLNINQLATAVKPLIMPGEEVEIRIVQEGKESGQGVGFLDDGTMVVVEEGRRHLNNRIDVVVTRVLQTTVGRMIFAQLKNGVSRDKAAKG